MRLNKCGMFAILTMMSCGTHHSSRDYSQTKADVDTSKVLVLGQGYDDHSEVAKANCIKFDFKDSEVIYTGSQSTTTKFERGMSYESLKALLDVKVKGKLSYGVYNAKGAASFLNESKTNEYSESITFSTIVNGKSAQLKKLDLSQLGQKMKNTFDSNRIMETCGNHFVRTVDLGSMLLYNVKFDFKNEDIKSKFEAEIDFNYASIFSVSGSAKVADDRFKNNVNVKIFAMQVGGKNQKLSKILTETGSDRSTIGKDGVNIIDCQISDEGGIEACRKILKRMMEYASNDYPSQLSNLSYSFDAIADDSKSTAAVLKYHTSKYSSAGVSLFDQPVSPLEQAIIDTRKAVDIKYQKLSQHLLRAEKLKDMRASKDEREKIRDTYDIIKRNYDKLVQVAIACYDTPGLCLDKYREYKEEKYNPENLKVTLRFYDYCLLRKLYSKSVQNSLKIIAESLDVSMEDSSCEDIELSLEAQTLLDLTNTNIRDLRPLAKLDKIEHLYLGKNGILNVSPLGTMGSLKKVILRENKITNPSALANNQRLEYLDLSHNRLFESDSFERFKNLKTLKLHGNQIEDFGKVSSLGIETLYRNVDDICEYERAYLLDHQLISQGEYRLYKGLRMGPLYPSRRNEEGVYTGGDQRSSVFSWVNCQAMFYLY